MIKYSNELKKEDLAGKKVLLRADLDVPIERVQGSGFRVQEDFRIKAQKETVDYLLNNGAKVLMMAHLGHEVSDASFGPVVEEIGEILGQKIVLFPLGEFLTGNCNLETVNLALLDNLRQDKREVENDEGFARELSDGFDIYVNNCFATMHREHSSLVAITKFLPSYAGLLVRKEIENLKQTMDASAEGKVLVLGGAKISTKLPVIKNFLRKAEKILIGGALANDFFEAQGINVGASVVDQSVEPDVKNEKIILPEDVLISNDKTGKSAAEPYPVKDIPPSHLILDIGPETAKHYSEIIQNAKMVIWNGPMGYFESKSFEEGTEIIAQAVARAERSVIGGGDTIAAVNKFGLLDKYTFVSTGGGAMLEFLAGNKLPGLEALGYY